MLTTSRPRLTHLFAVLSVVALAGLALLGAPAAAGTDEAPAGAASGMTAAEAIALIEGEDGVLRFDLAENATRFAWSAQPVHDDGQPAYGNAYITQGYIYPAGTLTESNGVLPDGSPEFPDLVLGQWTCRGWFVGDGAHTKSGAMVITTQLYGLGEALGEATLVSEGYELADVGVAVERAVTGGTGPYAGARGEARQTFLGFNASEGVNLTLELRVAAAERL